MSAVIEIDYEPELAAQIIESDARYFEMGAEARSLPGCVLAWAPGLTSLAAGCVVQRIDTAVAEANPEAWLEAVEGEVRSVGASRARLYLRGASPALEGILRRSGYRCRTERVLVSSSSQYSRADSGRVVLREVSSDEDWEAKRAVHGAESDGADGYQNDASQWVELIRRKWRTGQKRCFLMQCGHEICGSVGLVECGQMWRVKNVLVLPAWQRQGIGLDALAELARMARAAGTAYLGLLIVAGHPAASLYENTGYRAVSTLWEWTKSLN